MSLYPSENDIFYLNMRIASLELRNTRLKNTLDRAYDMLLNYNHNEEVKEILLEIEKIEKE